MSRHRLTLETTPPAAGTLFSFTGDEAWHAVAVKRVQQGDTVELLDGQGTVATATVTGSQKRKRDALLDLRVESVRQEPPTSPRVEVWSAVPKADRAAHMIDQLAQAGAAAWRPLVASRSVTDADHKSERLHRIATEASKQCGRAWHMTIGAPASIADATAWSAAHKPPTCAMLVADADGSRPSDLPLADHLVVLIGPEGGFTDAELASLRAANAGTVWLGPHVLRTETASVAAAVALLCR